MSKKRETWATEAIKRLAFIADSPIVSHQEAASFRRAIAVLKAAEKAVVVSEANRFFPHLFPRGDMKNQNLASSINRAREALDKCAKREKSAKRERNARRECAKREKGKG